MTGAVKKKYRVTFGGTTLEVEVEEIGATDPPPPPPPPPTGKLLIHVPAEAALAEACSSIGEGGKIVITGEVQVSTPVMLGARTGAGPKNVTIEGARGNEFDKLIDACADQTGALITIGSAGNTIQNLTIEGKFSTLRRGIKGYENAHRLTVSNCKLRHFARHAIDVDGNDTLIDRCDIRRILWFDPSQPANRNDAHGVVTMSSNGLIIRNSMIGQCSGDAFQADRSARWNNVLIEDCVLWDAPLDSDIGGFKAGDRVSENAIDTKTSTVEGERTIVLRRVEMFGFGAGANGGPPALITNAAAVNAKEKVHVVLDDCDIHDCNWGLRLRGSSDGKKLRATVVNSRITNCAVAVRGEDLLNDFVMRDCYFADCTRYWQKAPQTQPWGPERGGYQRWEFTNNQVQSSTLTAFPIPDAEDRYSPGGPYKPDETNRVIQ